MFWVGKWRICSAAMIFALFLLSILTSAGEPNFYLMSSYAGTGSGGNSGDGGAATAALLNSPREIWMDSTGVMYITDYLTYVVRSVDANGIISTFAGTGSSSPAGDGVRATSANINSFAIWGNSVGTVFIGDYSDHSVRSVVVSSTIITRYAGTGTSSSTGDNGKATSATLGTVYGLGGDSVGNLYIVINNYSTVRRIVYTTSIITTFCGTGTRTYNNENLAATSTNLNDPVHVVPALTLIVHISEASGCRIRSVSSTGIVTTTVNLAGTCSYSGDGGPASSAQLNGPMGMYQDSSGYLFIASQTDFRIRQVTPASIIYTVAGSGTSGYTGNGGPATSAGMDTPYGLCGGSSAEVYIAVSQAVRKIRLPDPTLAPSACPSIKPTVVPSVIPTLAPSIIPTRSPSLVPTVTPTAIPTVLPTIMPSVLPSVAPSRTPTLSPTVVPSAVPTVMPTIMPSVLPTIVPTRTPSLTPTIVPSVVPSIVPTYSPSTVRSSANSIRTIVGTGTATSTGLGGLATAAGINNPTSIWRDSNGYLLWTENSGYCVRRISVSDNIVQNFAGVCGSTGFSGDGGQASSSKFGHPYAVIGDSNGITYMSDYGSNRIRSVSTSGLINTFAGNGASTTATGDGGQATSASVPGANGLWMNSMGLMYLTQDYGVRTISTSGIITRFAGTYSYGNDPATRPATSTKIGLSFRVKGNTAGLVYMSDFNNSKLRLIALSGIVSEVLANSGETSFGGGIPLSSAAISGPLDIVIDSSNGDLYLSMSVYNRVMVLTARTGYVSTYAGSESSSTDTSDGIAATSTALTYPDGLLQDTAGLFYIAVAGINKVSGVYSTSPTVVPTVTPTVSIIPTVVPSVIPTVTPTVSLIPTLIPTVTPTITPTTAPSVVPTVSPTFSPSRLPSLSPSLTPSSSPSSVRSSNNNIKTVAGTTPAAASTGTGGFVTAANLNGIRSVWLDTAGVVYWSEQGANCFRMYGSSNLVQNFAGVCSTTSYYAGDGVQATSTYVASPIGLFVNTVGVAYLSAFSDSRIRSVSTSGIISTYGGNGQGTTSGDNGQATAAGMYSVDGLWCNSVGVVYVSIYYSFAIRSIATNGIITRFAGTYTTGNTGDGGAATSAAVGGCERVRGDTSGIMYVSDYDNSRVRSVTLAGIINAFAGNGGTVYNGESLAATQATLYKVRDLVVDSNNGDIYIAASDENRIKVLTGSTGLVTTFAGTGADGVTGDGGRATAALIDFPDALYLDSTSQLYIADCSNNRIRVVYSVSPTSSPTVVPTALPTRSSTYNIYSILGYGGVLAPGGISTSVSLVGPRSLWKDTLGVFYLTESGANAIRRYSLGDASISTYAGTGGGGSSGDGGQATAAAFSNPLCTMGDSQGTIYITTLSDNSVRKVSSTGIISTIAGNGVGIDSGDGGPATASRLYNPCGLWVDSLGQVYITTYSGSQIHMINSANIMSLFAGNGDSSHSGDGGSATSASFYLPIRIFMDTTYSMYLAAAGMSDCQTVSAVNCLSGNNVIRKITSGIITTVAGSGQVDYSGEYVAATASGIYYPPDMTVDSTNGDLYISVKGAFRYQVVTKSSGLMTTFAGSGVKNQVPTDGNGDGGAATAATVNVADGVLLDSSGLFYLVDYQNNKVRVVYSVAPTTSPTAVPSVSIIPTVVPSRSPTVIPTSPTLTPSCLPSLIPTLSPSVIPSLSPSAGPSILPTRAPTVLPTLGPSITPSVLPTVQPTIGPTLSPTVAPSVVPTIVPTFTPSIMPSLLPTVLPSKLPTVAPSVIPTVVPTLTPTVNPTIVPTAIPTILPTLVPTADPSVTPTVAPTGPSVSPLIPPTAVPTSPRSSMNNIATVAGTGIQSSTGTGGPATAATFNAPRSVWQDSVGFLYIGEQTGSCIRKFSTANNIVVNVAGVCGTTNYGGNNGPATVALFNSPVASMVDTQGQVFICDVNNNLVRKVSINSIISIYVGTTSSTSSGDGGQATAAGFQTPCGIWFNSAALMYVTSSSGFLVRSINSNGIINAFAGVGTSSFFGSGWPATSAGLSIPERVYGDSTGLIYISASNNHKVRTVTTSNILYNFFGNGDSTYAGEDLSPLLYGLNYPTGVVVDPDNGDVYVAQRNGARVAVLTASSQLGETFAGGGSGSGGDSGAATSIVLQGPDGMYMDTLGVLYITEYTGHRIRKIYSTEPTVSPTAIPTTMKPTVNPTRGPTVTPTCIPTLSPTKTPSYLPTVVPTVTPSLTPTVIPTRSPTLNPTLLPTVNPTVTPSVLPTLSPSVLPTLTPTTKPSTLPSLLPTVLPSLNPTALPSLLPSAIPSVVPTCGPTVDPTVKPVVQPTVLPTLTPSLMPSILPSMLPTVLPTQVLNSQYPSVVPSIQPTFNPTTVPTTQPSVMPSVVPSVSPTLLPTLTPSCIPSSQPVTDMPVLDPTEIPSSVPISLFPTAEKIGMDRPTVCPSIVPSVVPSIEPSVVPSTIAPSVFPSTVPTAKPSTQPTLAPSVVPSVNPSLLPSVTPTTSPTRPSLIPSLLPTVCPSIAPSRAPSCFPSVLPSVGPTITPTLGPSFGPSTAPTAFPSLLPTVSPSESPTCLPSITPSFSPSVDPSFSPSFQVTLSPSSNEPSVTPTLLPSAAPSVEPSLIPSLVPTCLPTVEPTLLPSVVPSAVPTLLPSVKPSLSPSQLPSVSPTTVPSRTPSTGPSMLPTAIPIQTISVHPTSPTLKPTNNPTLRPSLKPTRSPTVVPTIKPSAVPSVRPTTATPTLVPTQPLPTYSVAPSVEPTLSLSPSIAPTTAPTAEPSIAPSLLPSVTPSISPSWVPTIVPSIDPSAAPSTVEFYVSHPKATLPTNQSISVIGDASMTFKIVLPFLTMSSGAFGSPFSDVVATSTTDGTTYLVEGGRNLPAVVNVGSVTVFSGSLAFDSSKRSVSVLGDVNGDGFNDLIIGDPYSSACYVMFGNALGLINMTAGFTIIGEQISDLTGWSVSDAGDVNNDTLADIIVGAPFANGVGAVYVIYGRRLNSFDVYLNNLTSSQGFTVYGGQKSDYLGISVSNAGDVNKDGCDDIIVGAVMTSAYFAGAAYVIYGRSITVTGMSTAQLAISQGYKLSGTSYSYVGYSVSSAGDVNKDGCGDVLIGSSPQRTTLTVTAYLVYGSASQPSNLALAGLTSPQGVRVVGAGVNVRSAGDVNHDGLADFLVEGSFTSAPGNVGYIVYSNITFMTKLTSKPSTLPTNLPLFIPTLFPSRSPSRIPTVIPTRQPTVTPTFAPSAPTFLPTVGATEPTSQPSTSPTVPTVAPSAAPSEAPTQSPSEQPSENPTVTPSFAPSEAPTAVPTAPPTATPSLTQTDAPSSSAPSVPAVTRAPFSLPTLRPTNASQFLPQFTTYVVTTPNSVVNQSQPHTQYVVNSTGHVIINNNAGNIKYSIVANPHSLLTIATLNRSNDVIDLTVFRMIGSFTQLNLTEGSVVVTLPYHQKIHILNLHLSDVSAANFLLYQTDSSIPEPSKTVKQLSLAAGIVIAVVGFLFLSYLSYRFYSSKMKERAARLFKNQDHFLVTVKYNSDGTDFEHEFDDDEDVESNWDWDEFSWKSNELESVNDQESQFAAGLPMERSIDSPPLSDFSINSSGDFVDKL